MENFRTGLPSDGFLVAGLGRGSIMYRDSLASSSSFFLLQQKQDIKQCVPVFSLSIHSTNRKNEGHTDRKTGRLVEG